MPPTTSSASKTPLKLLFLHGYTQSGPLFRSKTRALEKHLAKSFPNHTVTLSYPTAPIRLDPADIPGAVVTAADGDEGRSEAYAWWRRRDVFRAGNGEVELSEAEKEEMGPEYDGLDIGLNAIAEVLESEGPFDGVVGFSQGAAAAGLVASLLERPERIEAFENAVKSDKTGLVSSFPESFRPEKLNHPRLKFAVCYSGFAAPGKRYAAFWSPKVSTPVLHVLGSLDTVVDEGRSRTLVDACVEGEGKGGERVVFHPGGHFLPCQRQWMDVLVGWVRRWVVEEEASKGKEEESVEDMDVPF